MVLGSTPPGSLKKVMVCFQSLESCIIDVLLSFFGRCFSSKSRLSGMSHPPWDWKVQLWMWSWQPYVAGRAACWWPPKKPRRTAPGNDGLYLSQSLTHGVILNLVVMYRSRNLLSGKLVKVMKCKEVKGEEPKPSLLKMEML